MRRPNTLGASPLLDVTSYAKGLNLQRNLQLFRGPRGLNLPLGGPKLGMAPGPKGATIRYSRVAGWGAGISVGGLGPPHFEVIVKD